MLCQMRAEGQGQGLIPTWSNSKKMVKFGMKKRHTSSLIVIVIIALALGIPGFILYTRPPVLVVTDVSFMSLYGKNRIRLQMLRCSITLFRPVLPVTIADDAGDDILLFAVSNMSSRPFCVLFPYRFAEAARFYRERFPGVPVVLLEGSAVIEFDRESNRDKDNVRDNEHKDLRNNICKNEHEDGRLISLSKGDALLIAPRERHRVAFTSSDPPCVWLCVFY